MSEDTAAVTRYRDRIHRQQRTANELAIQVGLEAQDQDDTGALAETAKCQDQAIQVLEHARAALTDSTDSHADIADDLGHSMEPLDVEPLTSLGRGDPSSFFDLGR